MRLNTQTSFLSIAPVLSVLSRLGAARSSALRQSRTHRAALSVAAIVAIAVPLVTGASQPAQTFGVRVIDSRGEPLSGVAVCFGTQGNYKHYGARFTDESGTAVLEIPNVPLVVTISRNRFTGTRLQEPARRYSLIKEVRLQEGVPGPHCKAGSSLADKADVAPIRVYDIAIGGTDASRLLRPRLSVTPSHYRISNEPDLAQADWQPYSNEIALSSAQSAQTQLYLQLRNRIGSERSWIESHSDVITIVLPSS